jgi:hypothetical protein
VTTCSFGRSGPIDGCIDGTFGDERLLPREVVGMNDRHKPRETKSV